MPGRRSVLAALAALAAVFLAPAAEAHHGIVFTDDEQIRITGIVVQELEGNPHFEIKVQEGENRWSVDLGNPYRIKKAGLSWNGSDMPIGKTITVEGFPAVDESLKTMDARTIWIDDEPHVLFEEGEPKY